MDLTEYFAKTAKTVDLDGFAVKVRKLTIKEHREHEARAKEAVSDTDWIAVHSQLIAVAAVEPKMTADAVQECLSVGDVVALALAIVEHSNPKKT